MFPCPDNSFNRFGLKIKNITLFVREERTYVVDEWYSQVKYYMVTTYY